jgi:F-type H+-transporting ATPase subunit gamma
MLSGTGSETHHLVVVATSDRGLCGGFNSAVVRAAREEIQTLLAAGKKVRILTIGRKSRDQLRRLYADKIIHSFDLSAVKVLNLEVALPISEMINAEFSEGRADIVTLFYSQYRSVVAQIPTAKRLIPAEVDQAAVTEGGAVYDYEPGEQEILETLLPRNLTVQILSSLLENNAGFYAAQMSAMDNATRNAGEMINKLNLQYNRKRQAQITTELIEIIAGAEAI